MRNRVSTHPPTPDDQASARRTRGTLLILITAVMWSFNGPLIKLLGQAGAGAWTIAFYRSLIAGAALTPFALRRIGALRFDRWLVACVFIYAAMTVTFILATTLTEAANAIALQYTAPIFVFALSPLILRERSPRRDWIVLVVALAGVGVIFAGQGGTPHLPGLLLGIASGMFFGLLTLILRRVRHIDPLLVTWVNNLGSAAILLPAAAAVSTIALDGGQLGLLVVLGVFQFGIPYLLYTSALRHVPAYRAVLLTLIEPVLNPTWTLLIVGEVPTSSTLEGGALIVAAVALQVVLALRRSR